jgi:Domain of unknown function (DUF6471)
MALMSTMIQPSEGKEHTEDRQRKVKGILKAELKRGYVGYKKLAEKLGALGVKESERNIANKIARGSFTAVFFVQCLEAIDCHTVHLTES